MGWFLTASAAAEALLTTEDFAFCRPELGSDSMDETKWSFWLAKSDMLKEISMNWLSMDGEGGQVCECCYSCQSFGCEDVDVRLRKKQVHRRVC